MDLVIMPIIKKEYYRGSCEYGKKSGKENYN